MRPDPDRPSRARRRGFAVVVTLVTAFGLVTSCSDEGTDTPAISGENPGEVTIPTLPPTTTADDTTATTGADTTVPGDDPSDDPTDSSSPTTTPTGQGEGGRDGGDTESDSPQTVPPEG